MGERESDQLVRPRLIDAFLEVERAVAVLTLDRDDVRNALTGTALVDDICSVISWLNHEPDISTLVIASSGSAFSAGGNIKDMARRAGDFGGTAAEVARNYRLGIQRMALAMDGLEIPSIAVVDGAAVGAGCDLATMADIRLASTEASFGETFLNLGIIPGDGGAWFLQRCVGYQRAAELTFTGRTVKAQEAKEIGLVLEVYARDELMSATMMLARRIASQPPKALRLTKRLLKAARRLELPDLLELSACYQGFCHNEPEHEQAIERMMVRMKQAR